MKLSELTAEQGLEAIANSLEHIGNIADDDDALSLCRELAPREGDKYIKIFARGAKTAPRLLKTHKDDVIGILAAFELQTVEEYKKTHKLMDVIKGMVDLINEPEVRQLFFSAPTSAAEEPSGDAQENTEEEA
jgi:hypothetical protein